MRTKRFGGVDGSTARQRTALLPFALLALVVERAARKPISQYMSERLWKPAGMENYGFCLLDGPPGADVTAETLEFFKATLPVALVVRSAACLLLRGRFVTQPFGHLPGAILHRGDDGPLQ